MDQNYNNSQNEFLWTLLANPANDAHLYNYNLQRLVNDFPQSGILQALLAHSSDDKNLRQASVYFNPKSLYKLINAPSTFIGVADEKIIVQNNITSSRFNGHQPETAQEPVATENYFSDVAAAAPIEEPFESNQPETLHEIDAVANEYQAHETAGHLLENRPVDEQAEEVHQAISEIPAEEHHTEEHIASYEHHPVNEITDEEHHTEEPVETYSQAVHDATVEEQHITEQVHSHHQPDAEDESVEENWLNFTEEPHTEAPAEPAIEEPVAAVHANWLTEVKDEFVNDIPFAGPIINYAQGLGHKMVPDAGQEKTVSENAHQEIAHDAIPVVHEEAAPVEHHAEDNFIAQAEETLLPAHEEPVFTNPVAAKDNGFAEPEHKHEEEQHAAIEPVTEEHQAEEYHITAEPVAAERPPEENHTAIEPVHEQEHEAVSHIEEQHQPAAEHAVQHNIEEEVFDEITGIENIDLDKEIIGNIAASNYFSFDRAFGEHKEPEPVAQAPVSEPAQPEVSPEVEAEPQDVSKYHDEKLPYSFLWWLDKTRKEHSGTYQPYAAPKKPEPVVARRKTATDELQQQYYENIFHITSVDDLDKSLPPPKFAPIPFEPVKQKEQAIIERFIQEEPQIRPQSSDKLDNENKAKKSSEDRDELVSETLAAIYSDQMLYHKAIASYKKLILKFPEKSRYFVEKIEQLEKKTN